jgi:hypothetical protein
MDATFTGDGTTVEPEVVALSSLAGNYATYQNAYVKVTGLTVTEVNGKNISVTDGASNYVVYLNSKNSDNVAGQVITAIGTVTKYNTTEEIKVWKQEDIIIEQDVAATASIEATDITGVAAAGVTDATKTITIKNGDGWNSSATPDGTVVTAASITGSVITYSVSANEGAARDGSITVTLTKGGESDVVKVIKVSQLGASAGKAWNLVTSDSSLKAGDIIAFGAYGITHKYSGTTYTKYMVAGSFNTDIYEGVDATFNEDGTQITIFPEEGTRFVLGGDSSEGWSFKDGEKYLNYGSKSGKVSQSDDPVAWSITITDGIAKITRDSYTWFFNPTAAAAGRFCPYTSTQKDMRIYRYE